MIFNKLTINDIKTKNPDYGFDLNQLNTEQQMAYMNLYNAYRMLFSEYFVEKLNLKKYDQLITESKYKYVKVKEENQDYYQYFTNKELNYFYLRNNIYIEHLTSDERNFIVDRINNNNIKLDDESKNIIESTYKKVIKEEAFEKEEPDKKYFVFYGADSKNYVAPNDAIVVGFYYDEFDYNGQSDDEWAMNNKNQKFELTNLSNEMNQQFEQLSDYKVSIIKYSPFSVSKRI